MLLLRLVGLFLLRLAERRFLGLLFHEPPRRTRLLNDACPSLNDTQARPMLADREKTHS